MSRPKFISIRTSHVEDDLSSGWHHNAIAGTADYLYALGHFAGAMIVAAAKIGVEIVRDSLDNK